MNTSTNETNVKIGGAFADGLTLVRVVLTPIVMIIIIMGWPNTSWAIFASVLFLIAALTDIFDDMTGGSETSKARQFGWFDDIADTVLVVGTLAALIYAYYKMGALSWVFAVPALLIIFRDILIGLFKGFELSKNGWPETRFGTIKNGIIMLAVCLLLGAPWLQVWIDSFRISPENIEQVYGVPTPLVWYAGLLFLWVGATLSLFTGFLLFTDKASAANDS